jgi:hypothetical protein
MGERRGLLPLVMNRRHDWTDVFDMAVKKRHTSNLVSLVDERDCLANGVHTIRPNLFG